MTIVDLIGDVVNSGFDIAKHFMLEAVDEAAQDEKKLKTQWNLIVSYHQSNIVKKDIWGLQRNL